MKSGFTAFTLALLTAAPALADCKGEVEAAFNKQHEQKGYHSVVISQSDIGQQEQYFDYNPPDRIYRKVISPGEQNPIEMIGIGRWAWNNEGSGWIELEPQYSAVVVSHLRETFGQPVKVTAEFKCLGKTAYEGKEYMGYQTEPDAGANEDALVRTVLIDPATGLPAFNIVGPVKFDGAKLAVKESYSYSPDIDIQAPLQPVGGDKK